MFNLQDLSYQYRTKLVAGGAVRVRVTGEVDNYLQYSCINTVYSVQLCIIRVDVLYPVYDLRYVSANNRLLHQLENEQ